MRARFTSLLVASLFVPAFAQGQVAAPAPIAAEAMQTKKAALLVTIDKSKVDLVAHRLEVKLSRTADKVKLKVFGESGAVLSDTEKAFPGAAPGTALVMSWTPSSEEAVAKIEVWGYDTDAYYAGVAIVPWNVSIPHEEVNFESASDVIRASEVPKLEASFQKVAEAVKKHGDLGKITLFIIGHTDTVGSAESNLALSRRRGRSIAAWFKGRGLKAAIAYEGMGESTPLVKTADEVDEPKNRRVDYILGVDPPRSKSGEIAWKAL